MKCDSINFMLLFFGWPDHYETAFDALGCCVILSYTQSTDETRVLATTATFGIVSSWDKPSWSQQMIPLMSRYPTVLQSF